MLTHMRWVRWRGLRSAVPIRNDRCWMAVVAHCTLGALVRWVHERCDDAAMRYAALLWAVYGDDNVVTSRTDYMHALIAWQSVDLVVAHDLLQRHPEWVDAIARAVLPASTHGGDPTLRGARGTHHTLSTTACIDAKMLFSWAMRHPDRARLLAAVVWNLTAQRDRALLDAHLDAVLMHCHALAAEHASCLITKV
jgi:hypothetical protein